ncbi:aldehyde dehydrogenase family protein [Pseudobutyrivibrio xylanivorans]|uniref:Aldehyde dehydrogenase n=1 Tax=Pseudobutyrivibrio xylanivorans DSM 14809 TaxID=1123012 RepID=A0A1M6B8D3_PSEXY|nr:aldehyde dehydrogenase family protein [Pseudobutyrivibrio xylanivorans]SHI44838.1 aldehyde dehydrogenase (NAD+) [Pseudobutyrivibrio xylanivorans DSM 14809]
MYTNSDIKKIVDSQRAFFLSGTTLDINWRLDKLKRLKMAVICNREKLEQALFEDLGRAPMEAYFCDIGSLILEINETIKGLKKWAKPETHFSGIHCFPSIITKVYKVPYGVSLIISPFNFPVILSLGVLTAAIAGGNTAIIKASSKSPACTKALKEIISETFSEEYITLIDGGHDVADMCLAQRFDKIFYTGSPRVGVHVLQEAAKNLTSTALELGGETGNWCIIRKDANLKDAARKIAFFKALNSGQICININQVAVANEVAEAFIEELKQAFINQLGENATLNEEYPHLINEAAYNKCASSAEAYKEKIVFGGFGDRDTLKFSPTILYPIDINEEIVRRELFCPLLPIVPFTDSQIDELLDTISKREKGLSLYVFTKDIAWAKNVMQKIQFGGGCINEVCLHMMVKGVPFNGVGHSGMGAYHGKWGFMEFTHPQTVLIGSTIFNLSMREHPYSHRKNKLVELFER